MMTSLAPERVRKDVPLSLSSHLRRALALLWQDKFAFVAALFLVLIVAASIIGPLTLSEQAGATNLRSRNLAPFMFERGWIFILGADSLGRPLLARLVIGGAYTLAIATGAVLVALVIGGVAGLIAGYREGWISTVILRGADIIMSFPSLLLALIVLYVVGGDVITLALVLALSRVPIFVRTCRAEVLEIRHRSYVTAARVMGGSHMRLLFRHIAPATLPTLINLATLDFAFIMLSESSLSFLGLGVHSPQISWGLMVSDGRAYLASAWWASFWPGLAITLTAISINFFAGWLQAVGDPARRARMEGAGP